VTSLVLEHLDGLGPFVCRETGATAVNETEAAIEVDDLRVALGWRTVVAAYLVVPFPTVSRPRTLISPEHVAAVTAAVKSLPSKFTSFRVSAAGSNSNDMLRWRAALADALDLLDDPDDGELLIRLRKADGGGWEVLLRLTTRPLATRAWRTERYEGGLNATIAAAVVAATRPSPDDWFVDLMCGSGTLLVERLFAGRAACVAGYDISDSAITATKIHLRNAAIRGAKVELHQADVRTAAGAFNKLVVNLPWGTSVGSHEENETLYPEALAAAARLAAPHAIFGVLTHELRVFEHVLREQSAWTLIDEHRFFQKGHWPHLFVLTN